MRSDHIETALTQAVDGVVGVLKYHINDAITLAADNEVYAALSPMLELLATNNHLIPDIISQASFAELLHIVQKSTLSDGDLDFRELDVALSLLSRSKWRWFHGFGSSGSGYEKFERLNNAETLAKMILLWNKDSAFLGGNFGGGAIVHPFTNLVAVASIIDKRPSLFSLWSQVIQLVSAVICEVDGVEYGEEDWLSDLKWICDEHAKLVALHIHRNALLDEKRPASEANTHESHEHSSATNATALRTAALDDAREQLKALIGVHQVKAEVESLTNFLTVRAQRQEAGLPVTAQALHFVFTGNPGTGKTTVARIISKILFGFGILKAPTFIEADRSRLVGGYVGQTAIKTSEVIDEAINGVLFIDEAYSLSKGDSGQDYGSEAVDTLLKRMEDLRDRLVVIVAGYPNEMRSFVASNPGLQSRFTRFIHFDDYSPPELCRIFEKLCEDSHYSLTPEARANAAVLFNIAYGQRNSSFGNARFVRNFFEATLGNHANRLAVSEEQVTKISLATIEANDLHYSGVAGVSRPFDVSNSKWRVHCPGCNKMRTAGVALIGNRVTCSCGSRFRCPWWNLVPESVPGLFNFVPSDRPEDLLGFDAVAASAP